MRSLGSERHIGITGCCGCWHDPDTRAGSLWIDLDFWLNLTTKRLSGAKQIPDTGGFMTSSNNIGCGEFADEGGHEYLTFTCPDCGQESCWNCSVRCTNDSTGEGVFTCPNCGRREDYPFID